MQRRLGTKGLSAVFIGDGGSKQIGGLPGELKYPITRESRLRHSGLIMTAADAGIPKLDIIGPSTIIQSLAAVRTSVYR